MGYLAVAWLLLQVANTIFPAFGFQPAILSGFIISLAVGFLPTMILTWIFEFTPEGLKREAEVDRSTPAAIASVKRFDRLIMAVLVLAVGFFAIDKFILDPARDAELVEEATLQGRSQALVDFYGDKSIAVLPFVNMSSDPEQEYFSDGISEELLNLLAQIKELRVISRSSAFFYKGTNPDIPSVAKALNVTHVLEGSVRKSGNVIRITAQLIEARSDTHIWSQTYDRDIGDIFAIQDEIAAKVVAELKIKLLGPPPTTRRGDPEAYALYLKARHLLNFFDPEKTAQALPLLEEALRRDPEHIPVLSQLGRVYIRVYLRRGTDESLKKTLEIVDSMLAIDPDSAFVHGWLAWLARYIDDDLETAARELEKTFAGGIFNAEQVRGNLEIVALLGSVDEAVALAEFVVDSDPLCAQCQYKLQRLYRWAGRFDDAEAAVRAALILLPDQGFYPFYRDLGRALLLQGKPQAALEIFEKQGSNGDIAMALYSLGRQAEFEAALVVAKAESGEQWPFKVAAVYAWAGDSDAAFEWLDKDELTSNDLFGTLTDPVYASLHNDPRYQSIMAEHAALLARINFKIALPPRVTAERR